MARDQLAEGGSVTPMSMTFNLEPVAKGRARSGVSWGGKHVTYTPAKTRSYELAVKTIARMLWRGPLLLGPVELDVAFYVRRPLKLTRRCPVVKPDLDNLVKAVKDSLNGIVWKDDCQIVKLSAVKAYNINDENRAYFVVEVKEW